MHKEGMFPAGIAITLSDVQAVYSGPEFELWELLMGQQVHIGGRNSSERLADKAEIRQASLGIDLCCCTGAGMRFLVREQGVQRMCGVDATPEMVERGRLRCRQEGLANQVEFVAADACHTGLASGIADFVWGEDAWCYVVDKRALIGEAVRLVKPGGVIAFTDWIAGSAGMSEPEARRLLEFMKFPNILDGDGYARLLSQHGCDVVVCEDTGLFASHVELYVAMLRMQLTSDALRIVGFKAEILDAIIAEMTFLQQLAQQGKVLQGRFVAVAGRA